MKEFPITMSEMKKHKYTTIFSSVLKPLIAEDKDKFLAMASLVNIGDFVPNIDTEKEVDLLPIAFNAAVVNRPNKNGDVIDTETALAIYKSFINFYMKITSTNYCNLNYIPIIRYL